MNYDPHTVRPAVWQKMEFIYFFSARPAGSRIACEKVLPRSIVGIQTVDSSKITASNRQTHTQSDKQVYPSAMRSLRNARFELNPKFPASQTTRQLPFRTINDSSENFSQHFEEGRARTGAMRRVAGRGTTRTVCYRFADAIAHR